MYYVLFIIIYYYLLLFIIIYYYLLLFIIIYYYLLLSIIIYYYLFFIIIIYYYLLLLLLLHVIESIVQLYRIDSAQVEQYVHQSRKTQCFMYNKLPISERAQIFQVLRSIRAVFHSIEENVNIGDFIERFQTYIRHDWPLPIGIGISIPTTTRCITQRCFIDRPGLVGLTGSDVIA